MDGRRGGEVGCQGKLGHRIGLGGMEREGRVSVLVMELNTGAVSSSGTEYKWVLCFVPMYEQRSAASWLFSK
jgi:hypothetical protein